MQIRLRKKDRYPARSFSVIQADICDILEDLELCESLQALSREHPLLGAIVTSANLPRDALCCVEQLAASPTRRGAHCAMAIQWRELLVHTMENGLCGEEEVAPRHSRACGWR